METSQPLRKLDSSGLFFVLSPTPILVLFWQSGGSNNPQWTSLTAISFAKREIGSLLRLFELLYDL